MSSPANSSIGNCQALLYAIGCFAAVALGGSSTLFFLRLKAVLHSHRIAIGLYGILWLANLITVCLIPIALQGTHIGPTKYCINTAVKRTVTANLSLIVTFDTLVFLGISWKLAKDHQAENGGGRLFSTSVNGAGLPISKALLQTGQKYYL